MKFLLSNSDGIGKKHHNWLWLMKVASTSFIDFLYHLIAGSSSLNFAAHIHICRNWTSQPIVVRGHNDSVSSFSVWGQDLISISKNKIGLSSLSRSVDEVCSKLFLCTCLLHRCTTSIAKLQNCW